MKRTISVEGRTQRVCMVIDFESAEPIRWAEIFDVLSVMVQRQKTEDDTWKPVTRAKATVRALRGDLKANWRTDVGEIMHEYHDWLCPIHFPDCKCEPKDDSTGCCNPYHDPAYCSEPSHAVAR